MITYRKAFWGLPLLTRVYGSAFPRALPFALLSALMTALLNEFLGDEVARDWRHPYPYQAFAFIVGFIIVFRSNLGYQRYWEGRTNMQLMSAKWADAVIQVLTFDRGTVKLNQKGEGAESNESVLLKADRFRDTFVHLVSLLHALALQALREDWDLCNLIPHDSQEPAPPADPGSIQPSKAATVVGRFSMLDIFMLRSGEKFRKRFCAALPIPVVGGLSEAEAEALGADVADLRDREKARAHILGDGRYVPSPLERVHTVMAWVQQVIMERRNEGGIDVPAPLLTRMYQVLSEGMLGFEQCRKLVDTPFPFPWAQMVLVTLLVYTFTVPLVVVAYIQRTWVAVLVDLIAVQTYWALNEVVRDLEDPFAGDPNELPASYLQHSLNGKLAAISRTWRPVSMADAYSFDPETLLPIGGVNPYALSAHNASSELGIPAAAAAAATCAAAAVSDQPDAPDPAAPQANGPLHPDGMLSGSGRRRPLGRSHTLSSPSDRTLLHAPGVPPNAAVSLYSRGPQVKRASPDGS